VRILTGHKNPVQRVRFSPDGRYLLSSAPLTASGEDVVRLWEVSTGEAIPHGLEAPVWADFTPNAQAVLICTSDDEPFLFHLRKRACASLRVQGASGEDFMEPVFSPDGRRCLTFNYYRGFVLNWWAYPSWKPLKPWSLDGELGSTGNDRFQCVAFRPDGKALAALSFDGLHIFAVPSGRPLLTHPLRLSQGIGFLAYHPEGRLLALGTGAQVVVLDTQTGQAVAELRQARKHFLGGAFTPVGRHLLTVSNEETVKVWDSATWRVAREYAWKVGGLRCVAVSPDGMTAAAGGAGKKVVVWDLDA
jgi:WD40 repeat protein